MEGNATPARDWIDPFCPLLSDRTRLQPGDPAQPAGPSAERVARALAAFSRAQLEGVPPALVDGAPAGLDEAIALAARLLGEWRQPLFGGLGTDVAGARALTRLGMRCGAILDHAHGEGMTQALRALQDRGGYTCTLSEVRNRADLILCIGVDPAATVPDFFERCGVGESVDGSPPVRQVVFLRGPGFDDGAGGAGGMLDGIRMLQDLPGVRAEEIHLEGADLHPVLAELGAACEQRRLPRGGRHWEALQELAARLRDARYAVLVHAPARLPGPHAALLVEAIGRIVKTLNRRTRAASLALGSADGSATVGQTLAWLTGLPPRTALHAHGFRHDPHGFGTRRLLASGAVDGLVWVSSFSAELLPPARAGGEPLPLVVLAHPAMAAAMRERDAALPAARVFIAVSTPGVNAPGQLFRGDGGIVLALKPFMTTALPSVADVAARILGLLERGS